MTELFLDEGQIGTEVFLFLSGNPIRGTLHGLKPPVIELRDVEFSFGDEIVSMDRCIINGSAVVGMAFQIISTED